MFIPTQNPQPVNNNALCTPEPTKLVKPLQSAFLSTGLLSKRNRPRPKAPYSAFASTTRISTSSHQPDTPCKRGPHAGFIVPSLPSTPVAFALPTPSIKRPVPSPSPSRSNGPNKRHINDHRVAAKPNLSLASLGAAVPDSPAPPASHNNWRRSRPEVKKLDLTRVSTSQSDPIDVNTNVSTNTNTELLTPTKMNFDLASPVTERRLLESPKRSRARHSTPPQIGSIAQNLFLPQRRRSSSPPFHILKATTTLTPNDWRERNTFSRNASSRASSSISDSEIEGSVMLAADSSDSDMSDFEEKARFRKYVPRRAGDIFYSDDDGDGMRSRKDSGIGVSHTSRGSPKMRIIPTPSCPPSPASYNRRGVTSGGSMRSRSVENYITPFARLLGPEYFDIHGNKDKKEGFGRLIIPDPSALISTSPGDNNTDMSTESYFESSFTILEQLGSGEFSIVFKVQDQTSGKVYAIKRMSQPFSGVRDRLRRLEEVEIMWLLGRNPHVVELVSAWEQDGHLYLQTELCEIGTLAGLLDSFKNEGIGERVVWRCLAELAQGLSHIHDCGILHLDLKPANILITSLGALKIGDFGLAIRMPVAAGAEREGDREYMAQEVLSEAHLTPAADVFSLGLITLEMTANIILPDNGPEWHRLRAGDLSGVKFENVSDSLIRRIAEMLYHEPASRPVVKDILTWPEIQQAITEGKSAFEEFIISPDDQEETWFGALPSECDPEQAAKSPRTPEKNMTSWTNEELNGC